MLGAAHALRQPADRAPSASPTALAVGLMLPHVVRFNAAGGRRDSTASLCDAGAEALAARLDAICAPRRACRRGSRDCGVERQRLPELAAEATRSGPPPSTPGRSPRRDLLALYEAAF